MTDANNQGLIRKFILVYSSNSLQGYHEYWTYIKSFVENSVAKLMHRGVDTNTKRIVLNSVRLENFKINSKNIYRYMNFHSTKQETDVSTLFRSFLKCLAVLIVSLQIGSWQRIYIHMNEIDSKQLCSDHRVVHSRERVDKLWTLW